jgi:hypothetical protein
MPPAPLRGTLARGLGPVGAAPRALAARPRGLGACQERRDGRTRRLVAWVSGQSCHPHSASAYRALGLRRAACPGGRCLRASPWLDLGHPAGGRGTSAAGGRPRGTHGRASDAGAAGPSPIAILRRDRAEAMHVADRWHLVRHVGDALKRLVHSRRWPQPRPNEPPATAIQDLLAIAPTVPEALSHPPRPTPRQGARWEGIPQRQAAGQSIRPSARALGMDRKTVRKSLAAEWPPVYPRRRPRPPPCTPHRPDLQERWPQGWHHTPQLSPAWRHRGSRGSIRPVGALVHPWRAAPEGASPPPPSLPWLVLRPASQLTEAEQ